MLNNNAQTILIVDDTSENIDVLADVLTQHYLIKAALNGDKALKIAQSKRKPDLILLDIMMPVMSGYEVCTRLKSDPNTRRIPVIFVTAMSEYEDERHGLELGAVDYITKPINAAIVLARIKTHLALYDQTRELERMVAERTVELKTTRQQIIRRLGRAAEFKDNETGNHVVRMSHFARLTALAAGCDPTQADLLFNAAPMHDVGKIGIPDAVLLKPGKLDAAEWEIMRRHPEIGSAIIGEHGDELLQTASMVALMHHEKWDGTGYPARLAGTAIPLFARIVAIADVFDALTSVRPYKKAWTVDAAIELIQQEAGRHFDPTLVPAFLSVLPEIRRIRDRYAEEYGTLTDLDLTVS